MISIDRRTFINHKCLLVPCGHAAQDLVELEHIQGRYHSRVVQFSLLEVQIWLKQFSVPADADHETLDAQLGTASKAMNLGARGILRTALPTLSGRQVGAIVICQIEHPALTKAHQTFNCIVFTQAHAGLERYGTGLGQSHGWKISSEREYCNAILLLVKLPEYGPFMNHLPFSIEATQGTARAAELKTPHGAIQTPVFMPVGTQGAIRSLSPLHLDQTGSQIILANTYHLSQRPGEHLVAKHGGLHKMMNVDLPILTDSGGFQVFSLKKTQVEEEGVTFA